MVRDTSSKNFASCHSSGVVDTIAASSVSGELNVEDVCKELDEKIESGIEYVRCLRALRNTHALVSRLPPEVLSKIFESISQDSGSYGSSWWKSFSHVCRDWRFIALESPKLWRNINLADAGLTEEMLRRSKSVPIIIKAGPICSSQDDVAIVLALAHLGRTRVLHLYFASFPSKARIMRTLTAPAPCLESLYISEVDASELCPLPISPFGGQTPRLRHIELDNCRFSWDAPLFTGSNLDYLNVRYPAIRPTTAQILNVLDHTPLLCTLILQNASPIISNAVTLGHVDRTVHLPELLLLDFDGPVSHCVYFLNCLSYPSASIMRIRCTGVLVGNVDTILSVVVSKGGWGVNGKSMQSLDVRRDYLAICFAGWTKGPDDDIDKPAQMDLQLRFEGDNADVSDRRGVVGALKALPLSSLQTLHVSDVELDEQDWLDAFHSSTELRTIGFHSTDATGLLNALKRHPVDGHGTFFFPHLRIIILSLVCFDRKDSLGDSSSYLLKVCMDKRRRHEAPITELRLEDCMGLRRKDRSALKKYVDNVVHCMTED